MADRPIIFSGPMVRALLEGRKTQTRRILKPQPIKPFDAIFTVDGKFWTGDALDGAKIEDLRVPYAPSDRLWVREAFAFASIAPILSTINNPLPVYRVGDNRTDYGGPWKPSIHMPREVSRLTLIVTAVKVERLQEISRDDAEAEGVEMETADPPFYYVPGVWPHSLTAVGIEESGDKPHAVRSFAKLWKHIHGPGAWDANPWVAAITFTVEKRNIDAMQEAA